MIEQQWQQKPWGWTCPLILADSFELWTAHVLAGGYSSRHWHDKKWNRLACRDAVIVVRWWDGHEGMRERVVGFGEHVDVPPGLAHRFEVIQSGRIWETYWGECNPQDIVRVDSNGWRPPIPA